MSLNTGQRSCIVICVRDAEGFNTTAIDEITRLIRASEPSYFQLLNPHSCLAFYLSCEDTVQRVERLIASIESLRSNPDFCNLKIGRAKGKIMAQFSAEGKIESPPWGGVINKAMRQAL